MFTLHSKNQLSHLAQKARQRVADNKVRRKLEFDNSDEEALSNMKLDQLIDVAKKKAGLTELGAKIMYVNAIRSKCTNNLELEKLQHIANEIGISVEDQREMYLDFIDQKTKMKMIKSKFKRGVKTAIATNRFRKMTKSKFKRGVQTAIAANRFRKSKNTSDDETEEEPESVFAIDDRVKVIDGKYSEQKGTIISVTKHKYRLQLDSGKKTKTGKDPTVFKDRVVKLKESEEIPPAIEAGKTLQQLKNEIQDFNRGKAKKDKIKGHTKLIKNKNLKALQDLLDEKSHNA